MLAINKRSLRKSDAWKFLSFVQHEAFKYPLFLRYGAEIFPLVFDGAGTQFDASKLLHYGNIMHEQLTDQNASFNEWYSDPPPYPSYRSEHQQEEKVAL
eukprot:5716749-Prymnesium_polylepis.1